MRSSAAWCAECRAAHGGSGVGRRRAGRRLAPRADELASIRSRAPDCRRRPPVRPHLLVLVLAGAGGKHRGADDMGPPGLHIRVPEDELGIGADCIIDPAGRRPRATDLVPGGTRAQSEEPAAPRYRCQRRPLGCDRDPPAARGCRGESADPNPGSTPGAARARPARLDPTTLLKSDHRLAAWRLANPNIRFVHACDYANDPQSGGDAYGQHAGSHGMLGPCDAPARC